MYRHLVHVASINYARQGRRLISGINTINTLCYNRNLIWRTVSRRVDEAISSDHQRRKASRVIQWYGLIQET